MDTKGSNGSNGKVSRSQAAAILGCGTTTVSRLRKAETLSATVDEAGWWWFDQSEVERVAAERVERGRSGTGSIRAASASHSAMGEVPEAAEPSSEGDLAARAFSLFAEGRGPAEAVVELRRAPAEIARLHADFLDMTGGIVLPRSHVDALSSVFGRRVTGIEDVWTLIGELSSGCAERQRLTYPCARCGEAIQIDEIELPEIRETAAEAGWAHESCQR